MFINWFCRKAAWFNKENKLYEKFEKQANHAVSAALNIAHTCSLYVDPVVAILIDDLKSNNMKPHEDESEDEYYTRISDRFEQVFTEVSDIARQELKLET